MPLIPVITMVNSGKIVEYPTDGQNISKVRAA